MKCIILEYFLVQSEVKASASVSVEEVESLNL